MNPFAARNKVSILVLALFFILTLNVVSKDVRSFFGNISEPLQSPLWNAGNTISAFGSSLSRGGQLQGRNEELVAQNLSLVQELVELQAIAKENSELREALDLNIDKDFEVVMATVIGKNIAEDILIIGIEEDLDIRPGMPVMSPSKVVVGRVLEYANKIAKVRLISEQKNSFDAKIVSKDITGIIRGQGSGELIFDLVPYDRVLEEEDIVVTSELGGIFPGNLLIGKIQHIISGGAEPFQKAVVTPFFQINQAHVLFIVRQYSP